MTHYVLPETNARLDYDKDSKGLYIAFDVRVLEDFKLTSAAEREKFHITKTITYSEDPVINMDVDKDGKCLGIEVLLP
jgi:hypothetical protein